MLITHIGATVNTRTIALIIIFTALAVALNPVGIPSVFLPGWYFRFWEIPIAIAFLLLGLKGGVAVALLRTLGELTLFPSPVIFLGPLTALLGTLVMLFGLYAADRLLKRKVSRNEDLGRKPIAYFTTLGTISRMAFSPIAAYLLYGLLLPMIGFTIPEPAIIALIPFVLLFDLILSLVTILPSYLMAKIVSRNLKVGNPL